MVTKNRGDTRPLWPPLNLPLIWLCHHFIPLVSFKDFFIVSLQQILNFQHVFHTYTNWRRNTIPKYVYMANICDFWCSQRWHTLKLVFDFYICKVHNKQQTHSCIKYKVLNAFSMWTRIFKTELKLAQQTLKTIYLKLKTVPSIKVKIEFKKRPS